MCHGDNGNGKTDLARDMQLTLADWTDPKALSVKSDQELFDAIRKDKPYNEAERSAKSNLAAIMGRMACESGQKITWDEAMNSNIELAPGLDAFTKDSNPPVMLDANGHYPVAKPGQTKGV